MAFTLDTYAHAVPGIQSEAAARLADLVFSADTADPNDQPAADDHQNDEEDDQ